MEESAERIVALVVGGGQGRRFQGGGGLRLPKPLVRLGEKPVLVHALERLAEVADAFVVVFPPRQENAFRRAVTGVGRPVTFVAGGGTRQASVFQGLRKIAPPCLVLVHDAVRPFPPRGMIRAAIEAAREEGAAVPALSLADTVAVVGGDSILAIPDRERLVRLQTPQVFRYDLLRRAHEAARHRPSFATDDATLVRALGAEVRIVPGSLQNLKITTLEDLAFARFLLETGSVSP